MSRTLNTRTIEGKVVRYIDAGDSSASQVLVLVHAFPMGTAMWERQLDAFPGWRVIAPALPGFDGSDAPGPLARSIRDIPPRYDIDAYAHQVVALLDDLKLD